MKNINFIKNIDNLGRVVIPIDIRKKLNISTGDVLSVTCDINNVILTKYSCLENNIKVKDILDSFIDIFNLKLILLNKERVVFSNVVNNDLLNTEISKMVKMGTALDKVNMSMCFGDNNITSIYSMYPILCDGMIVGSIVILDDKLNDSFKLVKLLSRLLTVYLQVD